MKIKDLLFIFLVLLGINSFSQKTTGTDFSGEKTNHSSKDTPATLPFFDDFEDNDMSDYNDLGGTTVTETSNTTAANGTYSLHITGGAFGSGLSRSFTESTPRYISFYAKSMSTDGTAGASTYFELEDASGNEIIFFAIVGSNGPSVVSGSWIGTGTVNLNQWYFIEFRNIDFENQTFDFYVDGNLVQENIPFRDSAASASSFNLHNYTAGEGYWDDIYIEQSNNALNFDGTDNVSAALPDLFNDMENNSFTFESWVSSSSSNFCRIWFAQYDTDNFANVSLNSDNTVYFYISVGGTEYTVHSTNAISEPTFVSCTFDASTQEQLVYFNGVLETSQGGGSSSTTADNSMTLGAKVDFSQPFTGTLDEVRIWDHVRTPCEISTYMNAELNENTTGLVTYYKFNHGLAGNNNS